MIAFSGTMEPVELDKEAYLSACSTAHESILKSRADDGSPNSTNWYAVQVVTSRCPAGLTTEVVHCVLIIVVGTMIDDEGSPYSSESETSVKIVVS